MVENIFMNIFILDDDIKKSVQYYCDKHVVKMILETSQILCTVLNEKDIETPYRPTHKNHPCVKWAGNSFGNFWYLTRLLNFLNDEYNYRYNKIHKSFIVINEFFQNKNIYATATNLFLYENITPFVQCMPDKYKCDDTVQAYRNYYIGEKQHIAKWTKRPVPEWYEKNSQ